MLLCKQFASIHYLFPIQWYTHRHKIILSSLLLQFLPSPKDFHLGKSPGLSPPLVHVQVHCNSVTSKFCQEMSLTHFQPRFVYENSVFGMTDLSWRVSFYMGLFLAWGSVTVLISGTMGKPGLCEKTGTIMAEQQAEGSYAAPAGASQSKYVPFFCLVNRILAIANDYRYAFYLQISSLNNCS